MTVLGNYPRDQMHWIELGRTLGLTTNSVGNAKVLSERTLQFACIVISCSTMAVYHPQSHSSGSKTVFATARGNSSCIQHVASRYNVLLCSRPASIPRRSIFIDLGSSDVKSRPRLTERMRPSPSMQTYHRPAGTMEDDILGTTYRLCLHTLMRSRLTPSSGCCWKIQML